MGKITSTHYRCFLFLEQRVSHRKIPKWASEIIAIHCFVSATGVAVVLPRQWALLYSKYATPTLSKDVSIENWSNDELQKAFRRLIAQDLVPLKLFFLVDGLDEYDGDQAQLVSLFSEISATSNVKALISSRPLLIMDDAFPNCPTLNLQRLNRKDIILFVVDTLRSNQLFQDLPSSEKSRVQELSDTIANHSNGVFLWAKLTLRSLIHDLEQGDNLNDIIARIPTTAEDLAGPQLGPSEAPELDSLYYQLWTEIPEDSRTEASQILQIMLAARMVRKQSTHDAEEGEPLILMDLVLADGSPEETITSKVQAWNQLEIQRRCQDMAQRLQLELSGFVEIQTDSSDKSVLIEPGSRIQFSHRAARDFVNAIAGTKLLECTANSSFNPYISLIKSSVQHLKILDRQQRGHRRLLWYFVTMALLCSHYFEKSDDSQSSYSLLLDELDRTMESSHIMSLQDENGHWIERRFELDQTKVRGDEGWGAREDSKLHWTNFHPSHTQPKQWRNTFLSLVVQFGLSKFVHHTLTINGDRSRTNSAKKGRPLLDYALCPLLDIDYSLITPEIIKVLLDHGANPNEKFGHTTCWQNALSWQYQQFGPRSKSLTKSETPQSLSETRLKIFKLLIDHGADLHTCCKINNKKISLQILLDECFEPCRPASIVELQQVFAAQIGRSHFVSLKRFTSWLKI
jgi:hypothetical protein